MPRPPKQDEKARLWQPQTQASRTTGIPARTIREWVGARSVAIGEESMVDVVELLIRDRNRTKEKLERLKDKGGGDDNPQRRLIVAQARRTEAEATLKELEVERVQSELIPFAEAIADVESAYLATRSKLLGLPTRLGLQLAGISDPKKVSQVLTDVIDEVLLSLSVEFAEAGKTTTDDNAKR